MPRPAFRPVAPVVTFAGCLLCVGPVPAAPPGEVVTEAPQVEKVLALPLAEPAPWTVLKVWNGKTDENGRVYPEVGKTERTAEAPFPTDVLIVVRDPSADIRRAALALPHYNPARAAKVRDLLENGSNRSPAVTSAVVSGVTLTIFDIAERPAVDGGGTTFKVHTMAGAKFPGRRLSGVTQAPEDRVETWLLKDGTIRLLKDDLAFEFMMIP